jgi:hypothetical protein
MIRAALAFLSTLVIVFSVTFVVAHELSDRPAKAPRLVAVPASAAVDAPLHVSTFGHAAALPALRRAPGGASAVLASAPPAPSPSPSPAPAWSLRARAAGD